MKITSSKTVAAIGASQSTKIPYRTIALEPPTIRRMKRTRSSLSFAFLIAGSVSALYSQQAPTPHPTPPQEPKPPVFINSKAPDYGPPVPRTPTFEDIQYRRYIAYRLKTMASDTEKLVKLARDLNAKIDKSGPGSLSREDLHTLSEIEKLAHNVKWKMQLAAYGTSPQ